MQDAPDANAVRLVINIDDIGMCHGANQAFAQLSRMGRCDSGSAMVPCPWFSEIVEMATADPSLKVGIHLTLNAEKPLYRWRPLTGSRQSSGLVDHDGYFWRSVPELRAHANPDAVEAELRAQINAFLYTGLQPSHMDAHMGAALAPEFFGIYVKLADEFNLPVLFPRSLAAFGARHNLGMVAADYLDGAAISRARSGKAVANQVLETPWHLRQPVEDRYRALLGAIGPGLNFMALHANMPGEIELIEPGSAAIRTEEFNYLAGDAFGAWLDKQTFLRGTLPA